VLSALVVATLGLLPSLAPAADVEVPDSAYGEGSVDGDNPRVESRLLIDAEQVEPGQTVRVGVLFSMDPKWHVYWRHSGDAGMSTAVEWSSAAMQFGDLQWPAPHVISQGDGEVVTFGYSDDVVLWTEATVSETASGEATLEARVDYLACKVDCIPGSSTLSRTVSVGSSSPASDKVASFFETWSDRVPRSPESLGIAVDVEYAHTPIRPGETVRTAVGLNFCRKGPNDCTDYDVVTELEGYTFVPDGTTSNVEWSTLEVGEHPNAKKGRVLVLEGTASPNTPDDDERLSGVVHLKQPDDSRLSILIDQPLPRGEEGADVEESDGALLDAERAPPAASTTSKTETGASESAASETTSSDSKTGGGDMPLWRALLFAFLGGMILNLMPCVFPVLALKVTSFANIVQEDRRHVLLHGAAYTTGIVGSMLVLAAVVVGLRLAGTQVGWGFQFQNPLFPAVLSGLVVLFALNLFGVFELTIESTELADATRQATGLRRSLGEGVLAVVLATPCSAPFLGTAVGFALTQSALVIVAIFAMLGLGLAAPFVVLTLVPGWSTILPSPGEWMNYLKKGLGFAMIGAAIWLVWIVGRSVGVDAMARVLMFNGVMAFLAWVVGSIQTSGSNRATGVAIGLSLLATAGAGVGLLEFEASAERNRSTAAATAEASDSETSSGIDWTPWSPEAVQRELEAGRPVFVDFTADWCITCKYNERTVLSEQAVLEAVERHDVAMFKADWTNGGEQIRSKLQEHGKAGVPMYLVYAPDSPETPKMLSESLSQSAVVEALKRASDGTL
jgi:thiol:disulfide interchange protein DsbD